MADDAAPLELGGQRQRALLALLLLNANGVASTDALTEALWGADPPRTATTSLHNAVSQLRKLLGAGRDRDEAAGLRAARRPEQLDLAQFELLLERARGEAPDVRAQTLRRALALWRGEPLADLALDALALDEVRRLEELRLVATRGPARRRPRRRRAADVVAELEALVRRASAARAAPRQLMLALYRADRQAEALQAYHDVRRLLDDELGLEPGPGAAGAAPADPRRGRLAAPRCAQPRRDDRLLADVVARS